MKVSKHHRAKKSFPKNICRDFTRQYRTWPYELNCKGVADVCTRSFELKSTRRWPYEVKNGQSDLCILDCLEVDLCETFCYFSCNPNSMRKTGWNNNLYTVHIWSTDEHVGDRPRSACRDILIHERFVLYLTFVRMCVVRWHNGLVVRAPEETTIFFRFSFCFASLALNVEKVV